MINHKTGNAVTIAHTSGNVGIGTTNPEVKLHLQNTNQGTANTNASLVIEQAGVAGINLLTNSGGESSLYFGDGDDNDIGRIEYKHGTDAMYFRTNAGDRMVINSSGNVGIGTTSPSGKLTIKQDGGSWDDGLRLVESGGSDYWDIIDASDMLWFGRNDSTLLVINSSGNVGFGTPSNINSKITLAGGQGIGVNTSDGSDNSSITLAGGGVAGNTRGGTIYNYGNEVATWGGSVYLQAGNVSTGHIYFETGNSERVRITNTGNVGIGTTGPGAKLHIAGATPTIRLDDTSHSSGAAIEFIRNGSAYADYQLVNGNGYFFLKSGVTDGTFDSTFLTVTNTGNVGIGEIYPGSKLSVSGGGSFGSGYDTTAAPTGGLIVEGNVGIGTTNPGQKLSVAGTIQATNLLGGAVNLTTDTSGNIIRDPSDIKLKENINELDNALEKLLGLRGVSYEWKDKGRFGSQTEIGFIAQEVDPILPEVVRKGGDYWSINTRNILAVVVEGFKDFYAEFVALRDVVAGFAKKIVSDEIVFDRASGGELGVQKLCVGNICVTEAEFEQVFGNTGQTPMQGPAEDTAGEENPVTTGTTTATTTPETDVDDEDTATTTPNQSSDEDATEQASPVADEGGADENTSVPEEPDTTEESTPDVTESPSDEPTVEEPASEDSVDEAQANES